MPYIKPKERPQFDSKIDELKSCILNVGQLNYAITRICHNYILRCGKCYLHLNAVIGVLACVKAEFYRIIAAPYEDEKIVENGHITTLDSPHPEDYQL